MSLKFTETAKSDLDKLVAKYPNKEAALLPVLQLAKREFKTISPEVMAYVGVLLEVSPIEVMNVVSFYTLYPRAEEGKYVIQVCSTLSCALKGAGSMSDYLEEKLDVKVGETTVDKKFTLKKVECLGSCGTAPVVQINDDYYENLTREKLDRILDGLP